MTPGPAVARRAGKNRAAAVAVLWMRWSNSGRTLEPASTLITGFQLANGTRWGRPVDVVSGSGRALYVTDDTAGAIYRLVVAK